MRIERRSQVQFNAHIQKEIEHNYHLPELIFEWLLPLNLLHLGSSKS